MSWSAFSHKGQQVQCVDTTGVRYQEKGQNSWICTWFLQNFASANPACRFLTLGNSLPPSGFLPHFNYQPPCAPGPVSAAWHSWWSLLPQSLNNMAVLMESAGEVPIDVTACCPTDGHRLPPAEYKVWGKRLGEGRGDSDLLLWSVLVISTPGHGVRVPWGWYEELLELGLFRDRFYFSFSSLVILNSKCTSV